MWAARLFKAHVSDLLCHPSTEGYVLSRGSPEQLTVANASGVRYTFHLETGPGNWRSMIDPEFRW